MLSSSVIHTAAYEGDIDAIKFEIDKKVTTLFNKSKTISSFYFESEIGKNTVKPASRL